MNVTRTPIDGLLVIEPQVFKDTRGLFFETWNADKFRREAGVDCNFVQDNQSRSSAGVLRGLHYQNEPFAQGKLVRVTCGAAWDVAVDIRKGSATFGKWFGIELSAANNLQLWIPPGFAHGFVALADGTDFLYKVTAQYNRDSERSIVWNDPDLSINWPVANVLVSPKDAVAPTLKGCQL
jgi:dTDP-4-dehydrorhamnose 3,5-epimerase